MTAPAIDHVIVLMLENRSFDNLLGHLDHPSPDFEGVRGLDLHNVASDGTRVEPTSDGVPYGVDPDHTHAGALAQLGPAGDVPANGGFVLSYERVAGPGFGSGAMRCLDPATWSPAMATLALEFATCTAWFSSVPGETWPNRNFAHAATSDGTVDIEAGFYRDRTIFELLEDAGHSWRIYYDGPPQVWCFRRLWGPRTLWDFVRRRDSRAGNWFRSSQLREHIEAGDLPAYTFIEPAHNTVHSGPDGARPTNSQHPHNNLLGGGDFTRGDRLVAQVYEGLRRRPELFERTLLVVTYDEHGGFYDHVPPPRAEPPGDPSERRLSRWGGRYLRRRADRKAGRPRPAEFDFRRLGVRVPAILVSPWIDRHQVVSNGLEHASIPATLRALFAAQSKPLTRRDATAGTFHGVVLGSERSAPRTSTDPDDPLPDLSAVAEPVAVGVAGPLAAAAPAAGAPEADALAVGDLPPRIQTHVGAGDLARELDDLSERVERTLQRRHPTLTPSVEPEPDVIGPMAAGPRAASEPDAAPSTPARSISLFTAAAEQARR